MKPRSMKSIIKSTRNALDWPILERHHDLPVVRVATNSKTKSHVILVPDKGKNQSSDMDYLHELGHATLCERGHPIFSVNIQCAPLQKKRLFLPVVPALNSACDWFVGHWQIQQAESKSLKQISESIKVIENVLSAPELPPLEIILDASMVIAQSIHYLDEPIDCGGVLKTVVDAFLSVDPAKPSAESCVHLVNLLLATYTGLRVRLVPNEELDQLELCEPPVGEPVHRDSSLESSEA